MHVGGPRSLEVTPLCHLRGLEPVEGGFSELAEQALEGSPLSARAQDERLVGCRGGRRPDLLKKCSSRIRGRHQRAALVRGVVEASPRGPVPLHALTR